METHSVSDDIRGCETALVNEIRRLERMAAKGHVDHVRFRIGFLKAQITEYRARFNIDDHAGG